MSSPIPLGRRRFLKRSLTLAAGAFVSSSTLTTLAAHSDWVANGGEFPRRRGKNYGPLNPLADQNGNAILALPEDFSYVSFGKLGDPLPNGGFHPASLDGMGAFRWKRGLVRLIRNHELRKQAGDFVNGVLGPEATRYDALGMGGLDAGLRSAHA